MVLCTEFLDGWWSWDPLRRSCVRCGYAENHTLRLSIQCSWWWAYVPETCRAKNTLIKLPCCIKLVFQIISWGRCTVKNPQIYFISLGSRLIFMPRIYRKITRFQSRPGHHLPQQVLLLFLSLYYDSTKIVQLIPSKSLRSSWNTAVDVATTLLLYYVFFWVVTGVWIIYSDVSEHSICSIFIGRWYEDGTDRVFRNVGVYNSAVGIRQLM